MSFRLRLLLAFLIVGLLPILSLAFIVRQEMTDRLTTLYKQQVGAQATQISGLLQAEHDEVSEALAQLQQLMLNDNAVRAALAARPSPQRRYLLDYAEAQMNLLDLAYLQIQDADGRILSSGHFRNEYDRLEAGLPAFLETGGVAMIAARIPEGSIDVLAKSRTMELAGETYTLIGGVSLDSTWIAGLPTSPSVSVRMTTDTLETSLHMQSFAAAGIQTMRAVNIPYLQLDRKAIQQTRFWVLHDATGLIALQESVNRWFLIAGSVAGFLALSMLLWLSSRISRPIRELAEKTAEVDLDRLDVNFRSDRSDEFGDLSRLLGKMTSRLRRSTALIKDAERRAAMGDLARQVNHDIKNGLTPIRNVFRHLSQLSSSNPDEIPAVFEERKETVNASIGYLQDLAANYARLTPNTDRLPCDLNDTVRQLAQDVRSLRRATLKTHLALEASVLAHPVALRRILDNLVDNAIDSLPATNGVVTLRTSRIDEKPARVRLVVEDNGAGMTDAQVSQIFQDFYTTKAEGTGLGLSIVRRLVMDL
ncbi:MAG: HAMP domain-containing sensor histidine kinase, partial [Bacteroidota bacterium]